MMRYSEKNFDREVHNVSQMIFYIMFTVLAAPIRLTSEIGKKIIFLGRFTSKLFLTTIMMNLIVVLIYVTYSVIVSKQLLLYGGTVSLITLSVSLVLVIACSVVVNKYRYDLDLDSQEEDLVDLEDAIYNTEEPKNPDKLERIEKVDSIDYKEEITDETEYEDSDDLLLNLLGKKNNVNDKFSSDIDRKSEDRINDLNVNPDLLAMLEMDSVHDMRDSLEEKDKSDLLGRVTNRHVQNAKAIRSLDLSELEEM